MRSHDEYKQMAIAHALNALEQAENREMEDHLATCAECRAEFDSWNETATSLAFAAESAAPSIDVRTRVLQQARRLSNSVSNRQESVSDAVAEPTRPGHSNIPPLKPASRARWSTLETVFAIAASVVVVSLLGTVLFLRQRTRAMESEVARLSRQIDESRNELDRVRQEKGILTAPDARMASLTGTEMAKDARAMIAYDRATGRAMLIANGLPPAPTGKVYQLWFIPKGKQPMPGVVFTTNDVGHAEMHDVVPVEGRDSATFAVTLERAGGASVPEGKTYLQSSVS